MNRFGLRAKLATGFGLLLVLLVLMSSVSYYSLLRVTAATEEANSSFDKKAACDPDRSQRTEADSGIERSHFHRRCSVAAKI